MANELVIDITARLERVEKALERVERQAKDTGEKVNRSLGDGLSKKLASGFKALAAAAVAAFAVDRILAFRSAIVAAASAQEDAVNQLNQSLISANTFTQAASKSLQDYAAQVEKTTTLSDEFVLQNLALARNFARSNEEARRLTDAAIELSAATGMSLDSAVKNLGKTFAGLTGELGESVVEIRNLTVEQLKAGDAIDLIKKKFDGFAEAQTNTYSGAVKGLGNSYGTLLENIGNLITQNPQVVAAIKFIRATIDRAADSVAKFAGEGGLGGIIVAGLDVARFFTSILGPVFEFIYNRIRLTGEALGGFASAFVSLISGDFAIAAEQAKESFATLYNFEETFNFSGTNAAKAWIDGFKKAIIEAPPLDKPIKDQLNNVSDSAKNASKDIQIEVGKKLTGAIKTSVAAFGGALAKGDNAFAAFAASALSILGDFAIELGGFFVASGLGIDALKKSITLFSGGIAVAAGLALIAIGGALKAFAGGPAAVSPNSGDAAGTAATDSVTEDTGFDIVEQEERQVGTNVTVNVSGNVLDRRQTGLEIVEAINEAFSTDGVVIARGAVV